MKCQKQFRWSMAVLLVMVMMMSILPFNALAMEEQSVLGESLDSQKIVEGTLDEVLQYYKGSKTTIESWWELGALKGADQDLHDGIWTLPVWESTNLSEDAQNTDYAGYILGFLAKEENPKNVWNGRNIVQELAGRQQVDGSFRGGVNGHIWSMIALDAAEGVYDQEKAIKWLSNAQKSDGGFAWSGDKGDVDITGMALIALSNHQEQPEAKEAIEKAVLFTKSVQQDTGGFSSWGSENANTIATVISGLVSVGEDVLSDKWFKNGHSMLDALMAFQVEDHSFSYLLDPKESNDMATCQVLIALGDMHTGESIWKRLKTPQEIPVAKKVHIRVEGIQQNIVDTDFNVIYAGKAQTALDALKQVLDDKKIAYEIQEAEFGSYVKSIRGETAGTFGGWDGWLYLVNDSLSSVGIGEYLIQEGDELVFYYGMFPPDTLIPHIVLQPSEPMVGEDLTITVSTDYYDWTMEKQVETVIKDATVSLNDQTYVTDEKGQVVIKDIQSPGTYTLKISKDAEGSYPKLVRTGNIPVLYRRDSTNHDGGGNDSSKTKTITLSVVGDKEKGTILEEKKVKLYDGDTPYSVLARELDHAVKVRGSGSKVYVYSIDGLSEFDHGDESGWIYCVNGKSPKVGAGSYQLEKGDVVEWKYTLNLKEDWDTNKRSSGGGSKTDSRKEDREEERKTGQSTTTKPFNAVESYSDIHEISEWARPYVEKARKYSFMQGTDTVKNTFQPKRMITRAEFATLLVRLFGEEPSSAYKAVFKDVKEDSWYFGYVMKAKEKGFIQGISQDRFAPDQPISRQEMAVMIARALKLTGENEDSHIKDLEDVFHWAKPSVITLYRKNIMVGYDGYFHPNDSVTREMAAAAVVKLYETQFQK